MCKYEYLYSICTYIYMYMCTRKGSNYEYIWSFCSCSWAGSASRKQCIYDMLSYVFILGVAYIPIQSRCAFCREVVPTKPFTNTALYYKMMLESEPTPLATKWFGGFYDGSKANVGHYKMTLRNHFVVKTGCNEKSWFATKWFLETSL